MTHPILTRSAFAVLASVCLSAQAFPIAAPGTEALHVIATGGEVTATFQGTSASYSDDLRLLDADGIGFTVLFNNQTSAPGTTVSLGSFAPGTELVFVLYVNNTEQGFFSGPASRNPDGQAHARVQADWQPGTTLVSFEDLYNGPFDFNDLSFSFTNTAAAVPEPPIAALLFAGLGVVGALGRRRQSTSLPA